jgi:hypothetical protein
VLYAALTFWLMIALLVAYGAFKLVEGLVRPRWINLVLLPGTLVAEMAHFLAALLTGAPVRDAKLVSDESIGESPAPSASGIPVLSPLLLALLPILSALVILFLLYKHFDATVVQSFAAANGGTDLDLRQLAQELDWRLAAWFRIGRDLVSLDERLIGVLPFSDITHTWKSWLFIYLTGCLAVRMVPLRGNLRSGMASVVLIGGLAAGLGWLLPGMAESLKRAWPLLGYMIALLTLLLLIALVVRGAVALAFVLADKPHPKRRGQ